MQEFNPLTSDGFIWRDAAQAAEILHQFRADGSDQLHAAWDWDGTIAPLPGSTWHIMRDALPDVPPVEGGLSPREQHIRLYKYYSGLQAQGLLTSELEREWCAKAITLHVVNRTPIAAIYDAATAVRVRRGAEAVFQVCEMAEVPSVILSAGIKDVIEIVAESHGIRPTTIVATELTKSDGIIAGWKPDTMVDSSTKREMGHADLSMLRALRPNAIAFGDQPHDANMFEGSGLRVRVDGIHTIGSVAWNAYLHESWEAGFDCVSVHDNLLAVTSLMRWLINGPPQAGPGAPNIPIQPTYGAPSAHPQWQA